MILPVHIAIALASLVFSTYSIFTPSELKLKVNYLFIGGTLVSGTFLVFQNRANFGHACLTGLVYISLVSINIYLTKKRLASATL